MGYALRILVRGIGFGVLFGLSCRFNPKSSGIINMFIPLMFSEGTHHRNWKETSSLLRISSGRPHIDHNEIRDQKELMQTHNLQATIVQR